LQRVTRLILVTASHLPTHKYFKSIAEELSKKLGVELEIREEDYVFLSEYGEKDEFGMAGAPQLFVVLESGEIKPILTKLVFNEKTLQIDVSKSMELAIENLRRLGVEI